MDDLTAARIDPLAQGTELDRRSPVKTPLRKREVPGKPQPSPNIEPEGPVEEIHQIDELA